MLTGVRRPVTRCSAPLVILVLAAVLALGGRAPAHAGVHASVTAYPVGDGFGWPVEVAPGDVNGDGLIDLVSANVWTGGGDFTVLLGRSGGTFATGLTFG